VYDRSTADDVRRMLPAGDEEMLNRAAECGLGDRRLAQLCAELARLGLRGARSLGEEVVGGEELERAEQYFTDWTLSRRSPADAR
jgi:hypothetical protein